MSHPPRGRAKKQPLLYDAFWDKNGKILTFHLSFPFSFSFFFGDKHARLTIITSHGNLRQVGVVKFLNLFSVHFFKLKVKTLVMLTRTIFFVFTPGVLHSGVNFRLVTGNWNDRMISPVTFTRMMDVIRIKTLAKFLVAWAKRII